MSTRPAGPRPNCFNYYTIDNHADISIFCNPKLLTNIRKYKSTVKVSGFSDTTVAYDQVGDHPYCGTVIFSPKNRYNLIAERVIHDHGHTYAVDRRNTSYDILDQSRKPLLRFNTDPLDCFYKVHVDHAFDFMDPSKRGKAPADISVALPHQLDVILTGAAVARLVHPLLLRKN